MSREDCRLRGGCNRLWPYDRRPARRPTCDWAELTVGEGRWWSRGGVARRRGGAPDSADGGPCRRQLRVQRATDAGKLRKPFTRKSLPCKALACVFCFSFRVDVKGRKTKTESSLAGALRSLELGSHPPGTGFVAEPNTWLQRDGGFPNSVRAL